MQEFESSLNTIFIFISSVRSSMFTFVTWSKEEAQKFYQARAPVKLDPKIPLVQALKSYLLFEVKTALVDDPLAIVNSLARLLRS